jgi:hypothetical protein
MPSISDYKQDCNLEYITSNILAKKSSNTEHIANKGVNEHEGKNLIGQL